ncbi:MAG: hypothetical protein AMDU1_APLC00031G0009 [Thermoplasmatales archaeon A-plasma]|jgi:hypothetical protein|nr:MAG: hypothetical protein AMDU1_APLC00031G0009 [Thermoplasmatales archaeon A-plasma]WMT45651.1 MAG: DUF424 family protein [Cuniculiplasma divulgatum]
MEINMKMISAQGEVLLAAADSDLIDRDLREGKLHLKVIPQFYGETRVSEETFLSSMAMCTIANLVGKKVVNLAIHNEFIDPENVIYIDGVPHAQFAKLVE